AAPPPRIIRLDRSQMTAYAVRRVGLAVPTLVVVSIVVFAMIRFIPGDVLSVLAGDAGLGGDTSAMKERLGIDRPAHVQYFSWIGGVLRGDFGDSLLTGRPIAQTLGERIPVTMEVAGLALLVGVAVAIPVGVIS